MFDRYLRHVKEALLAPVARAIGGKVSPTAVTLAAFAAGGASAAAALAGWDAAGLTLWLLNRFLDGLDGTQARVHGRTTSRGAYLDILLDFAVYAAVPLAMAHAAQRLDVALACAGLLAAFYVNAASWMYLAALLEQRRDGASARREMTSVTMPDGLVASTETIVLYALFFLWPAARVSLFWTMAALVLATVVQRAIWAARRL